jgi:hypothetical protein
MGRGKVRTRRPEEDTVGFMDKAKQMAEQAQQKIDDAQKQFNDSQSQRGQQGSAGPRYDKHGRPIADDAPPAAQTPAAPVAPAPGTDPQPAPPAGAPEAAPPAAETAPAPVAPKAPPVKDGLNATPDPFKPIE